MFRIITTYETMNTCKPNPAYFTVLLGNAGVSAENCRMIGNDAVEDAAAAETGMQVFLITDCLENGTEDALTVPHGSFADARSWLGL
jgi:FMN phosphatase YigB (HAD superfamily)